jgi:hypothetical protein
MLRGGWRKTVAAAGVAVVVVAAASAWVLICPSQGRRRGRTPSSWSPGPGDRLSVALALARLAREYRAPVLVVSRGWMGYGGPCPPSTPGVRTICFDPDPGTTKGEAEHVGKLGRHYGWHSLIVVATGPQALLARLLIVPVLRRDDVHGYCVAAAQ